MQEKALQESFSVSVVIPTHNRLSVLERAIDSARRQTLPPLEIIVVDDGSTDDTAKYLRKQGSPVKYIIQTNHGVSHARNQGIECAIGQWIAFLDSDDYWHENKLERQHQALAQHPDRRLIHCDEIWIRNGRRVNPKHKHQKFGDYVFDHCLPLCAISPSAALIHRDVFRDHGVFDESLPACEDYDLWLRVTSQELVTYVDEMLLTKTGGHADQLSHRFAIMDRFRIKSIAKLIASTRLSDSQTAQAAQMLRSKLTIVFTGAVKHGNQALVEELITHYSQWLPEHLT